MQIADSARAKYPTFGGMSASEVIDSHQVPATEILPAFAACCHNRHDAAHRAANRAKA